MKSLNVERVEQKSDDIFELFVVNDNVDYKVGNCIAICGPDGKTTRPYSFASAPNQKFLSFLIKKVPNGYVSSYLCSLKQGDTVQVSNPYGWFTPGLHPKSIFVATGTGVAPFLSSLRGKLAPPIAFYIGMKHYADIEQYSEFIKNKCDLTTICASQDSDKHHPNILEGRIDEPFKEDFEAASDQKDCHYYLCGLDAMIEDISFYLLGKDVPAENIHHECFFNSDER